MDNFNDLLNHFRNEDLFNYLVEMDTKLRESDDVEELEYHIYLGQLTQLIEKQRQLQLNVVAQTPPPPPPLPPQHAEQQQAQQPRNKGSDNVDAGKNYHASPNVYKMLSRNLIFILHKLPSKVFDLANDLLNYVQLDVTGKLNSICKVAVILLIDIFDNFPSNLGSLLSFSVSQIYKIIKKDPNVDANLVYLLYVITKHAGKQDVDLKMSAKLMKIATKAVTQNAISFEYEDIKATSTIMLKRNYILLYKNLLLLSISSHYESLLAASTKSGSASAKLKPQHIMLQQHSYQQSLLSSNESFIEYGFSSKFREIRLAMIDLLASFLIHSVPSTEFSPIQYLINKYPLPDFNFKNASLMNSVTLAGELLPEEPNTVLDFDSESVLKRNLEENLKQSSICICIVFYMQMEQFQNSDYILSHFIEIIEQILLKFSPLAPPADGKVVHVQNTNWVKTLRNWTNIIDFMVKEAGSSLLDAIFKFVLLKLSGGAEDEDAKDLKLTSGAASVASKKSKRDSGIFGIKSSKQSRGKDHFLNSINVFTNSYQAYIILHLMRPLIASGVSFETSEATKVKEKESGTTGETAEAAETTEATEATESREFNFDEADAPTATNLELILLKLVINDNYYTRIYAVEALLQYVKSNQASVNQIILNVFRLVEREQSLAKKGSATAAATTTTTTAAAAAADFYQTAAKDEHNSCRNPATRLISYSLALLAIIKQTDPTILQNALIVKILSFCTQTLKHSHNTSQSSSCWIILSSMVLLYKHSEYVRLNSSQLLVFWKNLLTSQYISSSNVHKSGPGSELAEVYANLKVRTFSLACFNNYLVAVASEMTPESSKQMSFLLTKSYNYLSHLESSLETVNAATTLNYEYWNESSFNADLVHNILYSNLSYDSRLSDESLAISLVLTCKKVIIQNFIKLSGQFQHELNSNIVIFLVKLFSDHRLFSRSTVVDHEKMAKKKSKSAAATAALAAAAAASRNEIEDELVYLNEDRNYAYGVTSLLSSETKYFDDSEMFSYSNMSSLKEPAREINSLHFASSLSKVSDKQSLFWFDVFDETAFKSREDAIVNDPEVYLLGKYSAEHDYAPPLMTSLVDLSIRLFQILFSSLSQKIQFSLLEQIRHSVTAKPIDFLRLKSLQINVTVALNGMLRNALRSSAKVHSDVLMLTTDLIKTMNVKEERLMVLNASSIGYCSALLLKDLSYGLVTTFVNDIVTNNDSFKRAFLMLALGRIYFHTKLGFGEIFNVLLQLLNDSNPQVHYYTLQALISVFESVISNTSVITDLSRKLEIIYLNIPFDGDVGNTALDNLKIRYGSMGELTALLKLFVSSLGPSIVEWGTRLRRGLRNILISLAYGIGAVSTNDEAKVLHELMSLFQELVIYDPKFFQNEVELFTQILNTIISNNLMAVIANVSPTSVNEDAIFPYSANLGLIVKAYACYYELLKIYGAKIITKETELLLWTSMTLLPCHDLKRVIKLWLELSLEKNWFAILSSLFKSSSRNLSRNFLERKYQQKLLPLQQRRKKENANNGIDLKDEENETIAGDEQENNEKNEPISWEFKLFIFELLNHLLLFAYSNYTLVEKLKSRIPDIVKLSFLGSTSSLMELKLKGLDLLNLALEIFGDFRDPAYPAASILEQQQAQIISALVPCFGPGNDYVVIVHAIRVSSNFVNLPRINFYSKKRILKILIELLEELSSNTFVRFVFLEKMSEFGKRVIQLECLNSWALLKISSLDQNSDKLDAVFVVDAENEKEKEEQQQEKENAALEEEEEEEGKEAEGEEGEEGTEEAQGKEEKQLIQILDKYSTLLTSSWILMLREISVNKFSESPTNFEVESQNNCWLNFVKVLSLELEKDYDRINDLLEGDAQSFFFVLFSQCVEYLVRNQNVVQILKCLERLLKCANLVDLVFNEQIFGEVIILFDRMILIDDDTEIQCLLLKIFETMFDTFVLSQEDNLGKGFDMLFEIIRVTVLPLFRILPFLKSNFDSSDGHYAVLMKHVEDASNLLVIKQALDSLTHMIQLMPNVVKSDLYSCLLYIFAKIYESKKEIIISMVIPHLKRVILELKSLGNDATQTFYSVISGFLEISSAHPYTVITTVIFITNGDLHLDETQSSLLDSALIQLLQDPKTSQIAVQCIKSLITNLGSSSLDVYVVRNLITKFIKILSGVEQSKIQIELRLVAEFLIMFCKSTVDDDAKQRALYTILLPVLVRNDLNLETMYIHNKLIILGKQNPKLFREVLSRKLTTDQQSRVESILKSSTSYNDENGEAQAGIELRTFG